MKNLLSKMLLPAALAGYALAQTVGMDIHRTEHEGGFPSLRVADIALFQIDTTRKADTTRTFADSLLQKADSTLEDALDSLFFGDETPQDTVPRITARDTMKVPEELRETDPFPLPERLHGRGGGRMGEKMGLDVQGGAETLGV